MRAEPVESQRTEETGLALELKDRGYRRYGEHNFNKYSDFFYQKKYADERGTKYYLEFVHYPKSNELLGEQWMATLHINEPHMTFEIHRPISIDDVERRAELFFTTQGCEYYELAYGKI